MRKKNIMCIVIIVCISFIFSSNNTFAYKYTNPYEKMVENILLIGKDGTKDSSVSRSDTMIVLTIDNLNKCLKLTSIARDTLVNIPDKGPDKLNHAYAYGGIDLLLETINKNFDLNIKDYAIVDFNSFIEVVNIIGGVEVEVRESEMSQLNKAINVCYNLSSKNGEEIKYITTSGSQHLNGYQALAYARIRKMDTIYKRDERQREILSNIAEKLSNTSITKYPAIIKSIARNIDVNISFNKIVRMAFVSHELASYEIKQLEFPKAEFRGEAKLNGSFVVDWNKEKNIEILHNFIYKN